MRILDKVLVVLLGLGSNIAHSPVLITDWPTACLASTLYHEARGEPHIGKLWVAAVVFNLVKSVHYPNTICDVVYQPHQFPWTQQPHRYDEVHYVLAQTIINHQTVLPVTNATHFHNHTVQPNWTDLVPVIKINNHLFYEKKTKRTPTAPRVAGVGDSISKTKPQ
jgi:spore germination cell wall hydrolase CwlJ-like protein